jgi:hypothetical protein
MLMKESILMSGPWFSVTLYKRTYFISLFFHSIHQNVILATTLYDNQGIVYQFQFT